MNQGDKIVYRAVQGRGRPAIGEFMGSHGDMLAIRNLRSEQVVYVNPSMVVRDYVFKPYNVKSRQLAA